MAGLVYDLDADEEARKSLFRRAYGAHAPREGFYSLDYYAPKIGDTRWDKSAEGAPIYAVAGEGSTRETGTGGGYGFYSLIKDANGNIVSKVGHGDNRYPSSGGGMPMGGNDSPKPDGGSATPSVKEFSTPDAINAEYDRMRMAGDIGDAEKFGMEQWNKMYGKKAG